MSERRLDGKPAGMKFCFILPNFHGEFSGGAETQCYFLAQELLARGWRVHYIRESDSDAVMEHKGIVVHAIPKRRKLFKWRNWFHLRRTMREIEAEFWYVRANVSYLPQVVWHARKMHGKSIWAFSSESQFYYTKRNVTGRYLHNLVAMAEHLMFFTALKYVDKIILQTENQLDLLSSKLGLSGDVIYNAHPVPKVPVVDRDDIVVWIGRLHRNKSPERFVSIVRLLQETSIKFYLVGDTDNKSVSDEVERQTRSLRNLHSVGNLSLEDVHRLLEKSKALVNTSDLEGFSNTFIEAWMRGVPVISLKVDPDNFIVDRGIGFLVGDIENAARKIEELINDPDTWRRMSIDCAKFSREKFGITRAADRLETCIYSICDGSIPLDQRI